MNRIERWTRDEQTGYISVEDNNVVVVAYESFARMLIELGFERNDCSCAMTEASFRACPVHGEDAPDETTVLG